MRALLVEDHLPLARALKMGLRPKGFRVDLALRAAEARHRLLVDGDVYDVLILDLRLPDEHGLALCRWIRQRHPRLPILILTALDRPEDIVQGLDAGADDYVVKPVDLDVLAARLRALVRRAMPVSSPVLQWQGLRLDPARRKAWLHGQPLALTPREFDILEYLMRHRGQVVTPEDLLAHVWGEDVDPLTNAVRVHIHALRRKLHDSAQRPRYIETVPGRGYRFGPGEDAP